MTLELIKIIVQPVALERDPDGNIIGERIGEPVPLFTPEQLSTYVAELRNQIDTANANGQRGALDAQGKKQSPAT